MHGQQRVAQGEAGDDVRAAGDGGQLHVGLHRVVHVVEGFGRKRGAGGQDRAHARQAAGVPGPDSALREPREVTRAGAEDRDALLVRHPPEGCVVRLRWRPVVEHQRGAARQAAHQPVPHHPAAGGEVEEAIVPVQVRVQQVLLQVLEQRAAGAVDDALGRARGARRVEDVHGVIEGQRGEFQGRHGSGEFLPAEGVRYLADADDGSEPRKLRGELLYRGRRVDPLAGIRRSRSLRSAPSARSARTGQRHSPRRSPASRRTRSRRGWSSPACR